MHGVSGLSRHVAILRNSYHHWTGERLIAAGLEGEAAVQWLDAAPFAVVSHDAGPDPIFNYANRTALQLFGLSWKEFTALPSRLSAGPMEQGERARLLELVGRYGYIDDYAGIRISGSGRQFRISNATVWNLLDEDGRYCGQAAMIPEWDDRL